MAIIKRFILNTILVAISATIQSVHSSPIIINHNYPMGTITGSQQSSYHHQSIQCRLHPELCLQDSTNIKFIPGKVHEDNSSKTLQELKNLQKLTEDYSLIRKLFPVSKNLQFVEVNKRIKRSECLSGMKTVHCEETIVKDEETLVAGKEKDKKDKKYTG